MLFDLRVACGENVNVMGAHPRIVVLPMEPAPCDSKLPQRSCDKPGLELELERPGPARIRWFAYNSLGHDPVRYHAASGAEVRVGHGPRKVPAMNAFCATSHLALALKMDLGMATATRAMAQDPAAWVDAYIEHKRMEWQVQVLHASERHS